MLPCVAADHCTGVRNSTGLQKMKVFQKFPGVDISRFTYSFISHLMLLRSFCNCPVLLLGCLSDLTVHFVLCVGLSNTCTTHFSTHYIPFIYLQLLSLNALRRHTLLGFGLDHVLKSNCKRNLQ